MMDDEYGCFVDDEDGGTCVLDDNRFEDCFFAVRLHCEGKGKALCKYWRSLHDDPWNDGLRFAINRAWAMHEALTAVGQDSRARGLFELIDLLDIYLD